FQLHAIGRSSTHTKGAAWNFGVPMDKSLDFTQRRDLGSRVLRAASTNLRQTLRSQPWFCSALSLACAAICVASSRPCAAGAQQVYSIGEPTDEEQVFVEFINRARANPQQEAQRLKNETDPDVLVAYDYFDVDLNLMVSQFASIAVAPPLSINPKL